MRRSVEIKVILIEQAPSLAGLRALVVKDQASVLAAGFQMRVAKPVSDAELVISVGSLAGNSGRKV